jgi:uncharacterized protein YegP (UPF0339 family)
MQISKIRYTKYSVRIINFKKQNMYTFKVIKNDKGFRVQFVHKNGNIIFWTESYKSKPSAVNAMKSIIDNAKTATKVEVDETKKGIAAAKEAAKKAAMTAKGGKSPAKKAAAKKPAVKKAAAKPVVKVEAAKPAVVVATPAQM